MKFHSFWCTAWVTVILSLQISIIPFAGHAGLIRLRNQVLSPDPTNSVVGPKAAAKPTVLSGVHLIQFRQPLDPETRSRLSAAGVDLLHYVPDGAFLARLNQVPAAVLAVMPNVEWVGQYGPELKIHPALQVTAQAKSAAGIEPVRVSVLLAPRSSQAELTMARSVLVSIQQESTLRAGTVLRGRLDPSSLQRLANQDAVLWIEPAPPIKLFDEVASKLVAGDGGAHTLLTQTVGLDGSGVRVAVADTGLNNGDAATMHPDLLGRTPAFFYYGALTDAADEHSHGTHVAGIVAGNGATGEADDNDFLYGLGVAPGASIVAQRIFDAAGGEQLPPSFEKLTRDATRAGAVIGSNSWGNDTKGQYDVFAMEFDELVRDADALSFGDQQYIIEFSAGNAGPGSKTIGSPAVAKNVIATGASENDRTDLLIYADGPEVMADFSSRGPCEDGRIKPDIIAPGTWISSLQSASATDQYAWAPIDSYYQYQGGTSQAGPHASGGAAVFVQYYREGHNNTTPSPALVKAALINSAAPLDPAFGNDPVPNMDQGWGRLDLVPFLDPSVTFLYTDQTSLLTNGQVFERRVLITGPEQPLKITLAYTDVPGFPGSPAALVNDLDLEVLGPDGSLYRGNQFDNGESVINSTNLDNLNNVEGVSLGYPTPGEYIIRVRGRNVVQDAREDTAAVDQDFALVISGAVASTGVGTISLDRGAYSAPSRIRLVVIDTDQAGRPSVSVTVQSSTETSVESLVLLAQTTSGVFTGSIATVTGPAVHDGRLQIADHDAIEAVYYDASGAVNRYANARADLSPPVITAVSAANSFGEVNVAWTTDEPATSIVRFGTNTAPGSFSLAVTNADLVADHSLNLGQLIPGRLYYYYVVSSDEAGNTATNNNSGQFYSISVVTNATVLLVDEYQDPFFGAPPLSGYTEPLDQIGVSYDVWDAGTLGPPSLSNLLPYRVVIWRVSELFGVWSAAEQQAITTYLNGGGGLFVASMEVLSRLETAGSTGFIQDILHVQSYVVDGSGSSGAAEIIAAPYTPVGGGLDIVMDYSVYDTLWGGLLGPDLSDTITPGTNATAILQNDVGDNVGLCWPGLGKTAPGRLVFLSTALDAAPMNSGVNDRVSLLRSALSFLAPGAPGLPTITMDSMAYGLPARVTVALGDSQVAFQGVITATASSTTQTTGISVPLQETARPGVFSGSFEIIAATNPPASGKIRAANGDVITVSYRDSSAGVTLTASAVVDTVPPGISNVLSDPSYQQAYIYCETTEPTDALIQFGQSKAFLNRIAYDSTPGTFHAVSLPGLAPNQLYYYRVVCQDLAGNKSLDDNHGQLYSFQTLSPLVPPWSDNMDAGAKDWTVYSVDSSQAEWTLGVPNNGSVTAAHSPPNAWGSNLNGDSIDTVESFLISPALYLTNGNTATLSFWHWYDFTDPNGIDIMNGGELDVVIDDTSATIPVTSYADASGDWVQEQVDLTPYMGQIIYLAWHYVLFSIDTQVRPGWLVDDVSITTSNVAPGTIVISNNLAQATYVLSGPRYLKGKGNGTVITNAPPGQYLLEFADVPYYITPSAQSNTLPSLGTISFQGVYNFPDANHNGISDLWETNFFGAVSPSRTQFTDTDGDGMTDYAEFVAGTDPNNPQSNLKVTAFAPRSGPMSLSWSGATGRNYLIEGSSDARHWSPVSNWMRASAQGTMSAALPPLTPGGPYLFRIRVSP